MKKVAAVILAILMLLPCICCTAAEPAQSDAAAGQQIPYTFASQEEGIALLLSNGDYHRSLSQNDLNYRVQKEGATLEEWLAFAKQQVLDFSDAEQQSVAGAMAKIEQILAENGYTLPPLEGIVFVKTTMQEECGPLAYTHGTQIYLGGAMLEMAMSDLAADRLDFANILCHELFHCLTRCHPQFREDMYRIIGFTVQEEDFAITEPVRKVKISNPDVEHHNAYAAFTINGRKTDCFTVLIADPYEEGSGCFFDSMATGLVPVDDPYTLYRAEDASDFWDVFGKNTGYVIDPEECLADNFGLALIYGTAAPEGLSFPNPEILEAILSYLRRT